MEPTPAVITTPMFSYGSPEWWIVVAICVLILVAGAIWVLMHK